MRQTLLNNKQLLFLQREKQALQSAFNTLSRFPLSKDSLENLQKATQQLDELFLIVAVGEFNAGKSALINALLGDKILEEGVTPTTARVTLVRWGEIPEELVVDDGFAIVTHPLELLKEINIVDSPGTNAINRRHERLTTEYVPRSDLVLFITSSDRPLTESERQFLEKILAWGKKVTLVVNKTDILENEQAVSQIRDFVRENAQNILQAEPTLFMVSARQAQKARQTTDIIEQSYLWKSSGLEALEAYITDTLDDQLRLELKLTNPLGVASNLRKQASELNHIQELDLAEDASLVEQLEELIRNYEKELHLELPPRLAEIENILNGFENRGQTFFDNNLKLANIINLAKPEKIKAKFQEEVQADVSLEIDRKVRDLIDWLVDKDLNVWYQVAGALERRQAHSQKQLPSAGASRQSERRQQLIENVSNTIQTIVNSYDRKAQAEEIGWLVQDSVTQTALFGVGAVGIGALVATVITTRALDVTGIVSAGTLAVLGLFVIPYKRKQAKEEFKKKMAELRDSLIETLKHTFSGEFKSAVERLNENILPYTAYVHSEQARVNEEAAALKSLGSEIDALTAEIAHLVK